MNNKRIYLFIAIVTIFSSCLHVASGTINDAKQTDFAAISHQLLDMQKHNLIDSMISTDKLPDPELKRILLNMHIDNVIIHGRSYNDWYLDSVVAYEQYNRNISIRLYAWEKSTAIFYDYATRVRDLSQKGDEFTTSVKKINDRLYIYKYKEPGAR